jgi:hypothetical protein
MIEYGTTATARCAVFAVTESSARPSDIAIR